MLKKIRQWFWVRKFFFLFVLFFFLTIYYGAGYYSQKKELASYKAKYEVVSALFKPTAAACPKPAKCPSPPASPVSPSVPRLAPASYGSPAPKETVPDYRDALAEAAEAAERAKREALREDLPILEANRPTPQTAPRVNPAINRRDEKGRLKPLPSGSGVVIREPDWAK